MVWRLDTNGDFTTAALPDPTAPKGKSVVATLAFAVNDAEQIAGVAWLRDRKTGDTVAKVCLWQDGKGMLLSALITSGDALPPESRPYAVSNAGHVVGSNWHADGAWIAIPNASQ